MHVKQHPYQKAFHRFIQSINQLDEACCHLLDQQANLLAASKHFSGEMGGLPRTQWLSLCSFLSSIAEIQSVTIRKLGLLLSESPLAQPYDGHFSIYCKQRMEQSFNRITACLSSDQQAQIQPIFRHILIYYGDKARLLFNRAIIDTQPPAPPWILPTIAIPN